MTTAAIPATPARIRAVPAAARRPGLWFTVPWRARYAQPDELSRWLATEGRPVRILLAASRPGYARLERQAFGRQPGPPATPATRPIAHPDHHEERS
jgi:hypothetical protein